MGVTLVYSSLWFIEGAGKICDARGGLGPANILGVGVGKYGTTKKWEGSILN